MNEIDILSIHSDILKSFSYKRENIDKYKEKLNHYNVTKEINTLSTRIKNDIQNKIVELEKYIYNIESNELENFYIMETTDILQEYKDEISKSFSVSFMGKTKLDNVQKNNIVTILEWVIYLQIYLDQKKKVKM